MPLTFSQNGHILWSMWTLQSSWSFEKLQLLVVVTKVTYEVLNLVFYCPIWGIDPLSYAERQKFISVGLSKYVDFQKVGIAQNLTYEMKMKSYVEYQEDIFLHLSKPLFRQSATLLEGFQPSSNWKSKYSKVLLSIVILDVDPKNLIQHPYYGPKNMWPSLVCTLFRDLNDGDFVLVRLHDPSLVPIWM